MRSAHDWSHIFENLSHILTFSFSFFVFNCLTYRYEKLFVNVMTLMFFPYFCLPVQMSVPFNRFWAPKRNTSVPAGTGIKVPSVGKKRKSHLFFNVPVPKTTLRCPWLSLDRNTHCSFENTLQNWQLKKKKWITVNKDISPAFLPGLIKLTFSLTLWHWPCDLLQNHCNSLAMSFLLLVRPLLSWGFLVAQLVKNLLVIQETQVQSLGQEDPWKRKWPLAT